MRKAGYILFCTIILLILVSMFRAASDSSKQKILINEVCSCNIRTFKEGANMGDDYIELYNSSNEVLSLEGWFLSDDETELDKYELPEYEMNPGEYVVFYANGLDGQENLNFKVDELGEKLFLIDEEMNIVDSIMVPELDADTAYSRITDGNSEWAVKGTTPGESNDSVDCLPEMVLEKPRFSVESGFYEASFWVELEAGSEETIYYTLDGSIPDENSTRYEEPIFILNRSEEPNLYKSQQRIIEYWKWYEPDETPVDKATVLRAVAINESGEISEVATETYFVGLNEYCDETVISLAVDPEELFGPYGIFVTGAEYDECLEAGQLDGLPTPNFMQRGKGWEVLGNLQFWENGNQLANQLAGVRVQGNSSRRQPYKRLSFYAREAYAGSDFFDSYIVDQEMTHAFMLNECVSDAALPLLIEDRDIAIQHSRTLPVTLFINGEYWYTRYLMEKYSPYYFEENYGVDPKNIIIFKNNKVKDGKQEDEKLFREIQQIASDTSMTPDEKYDILSDKIDIQSFIDFFSINTYLCNMNMNEVENYALWRVREKENEDHGDGRWRWLIFDLECVETMEIDYYEVTERAAINTFSHPMNFIWTKMNENSIFAGLKECERFRKQFVLSFLDIANMNFAPDRVEKHLEQYQIDMSWKEGFFRKRFDYIVEDLKEEFALTGSLETVTIQNNDAEAGAIVINTTTPDLSTGSWTGKYYTDYPVTVTAVANEGYRFLGWSGAVESMEEMIEVPVEASGVMIQANFEKE